MRARKDFRPSEAIEAPKQEPEQRSRAVTSMIDASKLGALGGVFEPAAFDAQSRPEPGGDRPCRANYR